MKEYKIQASESEIAARTEIIYDANSNLIEQLELVSTRNDLSNFISTLQEDFIKNKDGWENNDLSSFLEAMAAWVIDMDGYYINQGKAFSENQSWKTFAEILCAAKVYE